MSKELQLTKKEENQKIKFDFSQIKDEETRNVMQEATKNIFILREQTRKALGEQFSKVQKELVGNNQYNGYWEKWYESLGFKKDFVYDCITYYEVLIANSDNKMIQKLPVSKVCEIAKLKDDEELQKQVIEKAPLKEMKIKQVIELVKQVKESREVTDEIINKICSKTNESNSNFKQFISTTTTLIKDLKEQKEEMTEDKSKKIIKLVEEIKEICLKVEENEGNE